MGSVIMEHLAGVPVAARRVDLARRRRERGNGYEEENGGECRSEVEEQARVGEDPKGSLCGCRVVAWAGEVAE
jgi:hypothetical protein